MWKESYRIGVDTIDEQHFQLFQMVEGLLKTIESDETWTKKKIDCIKSVTFMKKYVVQHFEDEEAYQQSIHYSGYAEHRKEHCNFTKTVLDYETQLLQTNFDRKVVANFAGLLVSWLIYHVSGADQKITKGAPETTAPAAGSTIACFRNGVIDAFDKMVGLSPDKLTITDFSGSLDGNIFVCIGILGDVPENIVFAFSKDMALGLVQVMTGMELAELDEMVCSAMAEISNIVCGHAATELANLGYTTDITPPQVTVGTEYRDDTVTLDGIAFESELGTLKLVTERN